MFCVVSIVVVIRIDHGQILSVNYETVRQRLNGYSYTLAGKCSCQVSNHTQSGDEACVTLQKLKENSNSFVSERILQFSGGVRISQRGGANIRDTIFGENRPIDQPM